MSAKQHSTFVYKCVLGCGPSCPGSREVSSWLCSDSPIWMLGFTLPHHHFLGILVPPFTLEAYKMAWALKRAKF